MSRKRKFFIRFLEFFVIGVGFGLAEDLIAISVATDASITPEVVWTVLLVALPFAAFSELVADHPKFWKNLLRLKDDDNEK